MSFYIFSFDMENFSKQFLVRFFSTIVILFSCVICLNYFVDPAGKFYADESSEAKMAVFLQSHHSLMMSGNHDELAFKKNLLFQSKNLHPQTVTLGSSKAYQIGTRTGIEHSLNLAVGAMDMHEYIFLATEAMKKLNPDTLIIEVSPALFNANYNKQLADEYNDDYAQSVLELKAGNKESDLFDHGYSNYFQLVNWAYSKQSINKLFHKSTGTVFEQSSGSEISAIPDKHIRIFNDGSLQYADNLYHPSPTEFVSKVKESIASIPDYTMVNYQLSEMKLQIFFNFIKKMHGEKHVILLLSPLYPDYFKAITQRSRDFSEVEEIMRRRADKNVQIAGSYNPMLADCTDADFIDAFHPKPACTSRILAKALGTDVPQHHIVAESKSY